MQHSQKKILETPMRQPDSWDHIFIEMARSIARRSKDPTTQVGSILVSPDRRSVSCGFNGFPIGVPENDERWCRPNKYLYSCHSEINCILQCPVRPDGWTLYVTLPVCKDCAKYVIQAGISEVVYCGEPKIDSELDYQFTANLFKEAGVQYRKLS